MDAAKYAEMSDPDNNPNFRRRWDAPPLKLKAPPAGGTARQGKLENATFSGVNVDKSSEKFKGKEAPRALIFDEDFICLLAKMTFQGVGGRCSHIPCECRRESKACRDLRPTCPNPFNEKGA